MESERYPCFWRRMRNKSTVWRSFLRPSRTPEKNAQINGIENAKFYVGKAEEVLPGYYADYAKAHPGEQAHADVIVVDPPRKGCEESLLETMVQMQPERIVYVSCDSATLARDLKYLCGNGYELVKVRAVDQFSQTVHVETVVLLSHKKPDGHINVKVEFGEGEGKVPLDNIAKRAEEYKPKERVTYKMIKEYIERKIRLQGTYRIYRRGKERFRLADV